MHTNNRKKHTTNPKGDKGNWRYSNFQKIQKFDIEESKIKNEMRPENSFDPNRVNDYINPKPSKEQLIINKVKNKTKLDKSEKIIYDNYSKKIEALLKADLEDIEKHKGKATPVTEEGRLRLLMLHLQNYIKSKDNDAICNIFLKITKDNFTINDKIKKDFQKELDAMEKVVNKQDLIDLQFSKHPDKMPPLNQKGFVKFDDWQINVVENINNNISTIVVAPTSAGKTVLAGYAATKGRTLIVMPTDALCWQMAAYVGGFTDKDIPIVTDSHITIPRDKCRCKDRINRKLNKSCDLCTMSLRDKNIENFNSSIAIVGTPDALLDYIPLINSNFDWIIMDEIHMIGKKEGSSMELIAKVFNNVKFLALSATIGNVDEITNWFQKLNPERKVESIKCNKRFFNLQRYYYNPKDNELKVLHPLALVDINDFENKSIINKNLQPTPTDTWILYNKLKEEFNDLGELNHNKYFESREIVYLDKANNYFFDLIQFMIKKTIESKDIINRIINSFKNIELVDEFVDLVKLTFKLKEQKKAPVIIFQKNTLACLRMVRKYAKIIDTMEDEEFPDLHRNRLHMIKKAKRIEKQLEKINKDEAISDGVKTTVDKDGNVKTSKVTKDKCNNRTDSVKRDKGKSYEKTHEEKQELPVNNDNEEFINLEGLQQPTDKYNFNDIQYFSEEQIIELEKPFKTWFESDNGQFHFIVKLLWRGVGVYAKGLPDPYLRLVQKLTQEKKIAVLFSDMSLVFGVSMPFRTAVIYRDSFVEDDLDAMLYHQMAGRAGRRGLDKEGNVVFAGYKWKRIEELSVCPIPNIIGVNTLNYVAPHANKISEIKKNNLDWDNIFKNPLNNESEEDQLELLESIKSNYSKDGGWAFAHTGPTKDETEINHLLMMWSLRNAEESEPIIVSYLLPFIKRGFESMDAENQGSQIEIALFLANFISIKETNIDEYKLPKNSLFETETFSKIYDDLEELQITIPKNIDNRIFASIKLNKLVKTDTEKEADQLRERLFNFSVKIITIQHYFFEIKSKSLARLLAKLLTRIWWIYHKSSPLAKAFGHYDDEGEYEEVDDEAIDEDEDNDDYEEDSEEEDSSEKTSEIEV